MTYYVGSNPQDVLSGFIKRYFYGLRRNDDGELFLVRVDQLTGDAVAVINDIGVDENNFLDFEEGINFLEGIDQNHDVVHPNLRYTQFKWDGRPLTYFVDPVDGQFILRVGEDYQYPDGVSGPGF
jgi:hypothetical protein